MDTLVDSSTEVDFGKCDMRHLIRIVYLYKGHKHILGSHLHCIQVHKYTQNHSWILGILH